MLLSLLNGITVLRIFQLHFLLTWWQIQVKCFDFWHSWDVQISMFFVHVLVSLLMLGTRKCDIPNADNSACDIWTNISEQHHVHYTSINVCQLAGGKNSLSKKNFKCCKPISSKSLEHYLTLMYQILSIMSGNTTSSDCKSLHKPHDASYYKLSYITQVSVIFMSKSTTGIQHCFWKWQFISWNLVKSQISQNFITKPIKGSWVYN